MEVIEEKSESKLEEFPSNHSASPRLASSRTVVDCGAMEEMS